MDDSKRERYGALGGVVFVVLDVIVAVLGGEPPAADAGRSEVAVVLLAASRFGVAAHVLATSVLGARTETLPAWVVTVGVVSALGFLVSAVFGATASGQASSVVELVGFSLWCVWILGVSYRMWSDIRIGVAVPAV